MYTKTVLDAHAPRYTAVMDMDKFPLFYVYTNIFIVCKAPTLALYKVCTVRTHNPSGSLVLPCCIFYWGIVKIFLMDSAVGGRTEIVSIDFIFGRLCSGHLVLQHTLLSLSVFLSHTPSVSPFSSPCFPYSCSVAGLCHTFSFFSSDLASFVLCLQCSFMAFL